MDPERLFLENLALIERIVAATCHRHRLTAEESEDFASILKLKLIADDYVVLRAWAGRSSLAGYLTAVVQHAFLDYRNHLWGRWRPSAEARRLGPRAVRLETQLHRDGQTLAEICARSAPEERGELERLAARLPVRLRRHVDGADGLDHTASPEGSPEALLIEKERESARARVERALADAIDQLPEEDRLVLQLRLYDGVSLVDVSRSLGRDVRQIYRRWEAMMRRLRASLEGVGCDARLVCLALGEEASRPAIRRRGPSLEVEGTR
jgi:RNA polymerase sigma factor (sigma-70 family)